MNLWNDFLYDIFGYESPKNKIKRAKENAEAKSKMDSRPWKKVQIPLENIPYALEFFVDNSIKDGFCIRLGDNYDVLFKYSYIKLVPK